MRERGAQEIEYATRPEPAREITAKEFEALEPRQGTLAFDVVEFPAPRPASREIEYAARRKAAP